MPSIRHHSFGDSARPWKEIVFYFQELAENTPSLMPMVDLTNQLAESDYADDGLHGTTSMHILMVSRSRDIAANPHLRIQWDNRDQRFRFTYEDGSLEPWQRTCNRSEAFEFLERFLVKRARWFRAPEKQSKG